MHKNFFNYGLPIPPIFIDKDLKVLGKFCVEGNHTYIVLRSNDEEVLAHELAHYIEYTLYGETNHELRWVNICKDLGGSGNKFYMKVKYGLCKTKRFPIQ